MIAITQGIRAPILVLQALEATIWRYRAVLQQYKAEFFLDTYSLAIRAGLYAMPPKIRELIGQLERAGFEDRGGKGSHRNYVHPGLSKPVTISGKLGDDAKQYQVRAVRNALAELEK